MAAMKNPCDSYISTYIDHKISADDSTPHLYLVILKGNVFACKAISRTNAIDIASISHELGDIMEAESLSHGRPLSRYQIPDMKVIRVRPYHRGWWMGSESDTIDNDYIYVSLVSGRPTVYKAGSMVLDFASSNGIIHKVRVYDCESVRVKELIV